MALHLSPRKIKASKKPGAVSLWIHVIIHNYEAEDNFFSVLSSSWLELHGSQLDHDVNNFPVNMLKKKEFTELLTTSSKVFRVKDVRLTFKHINL